jgi:hypothetical protein
MVVGVNGAGKTTTIGKLTRHLAGGRLRVLLAAADTFRAAAREQLAVWADRNQVEIVSQEGGDPAAVTFDAVTPAARAAATWSSPTPRAGCRRRLHLMDELKKIQRVIGKARPGAPHEVLLVVDGNTGQNALAQVKAFDAALGLTGLIVTKLDGTAKGGVLAAIARWCRNSRRPLAVYFIGVGEALEDLQPFDARRVRAGAARLTAERGVSGGASAATRPRRRRSPTGRAPGRFACAAASPSARSASSSRISATGISGIGRELGATGCIGPAPRTRSCASAVRTSLRSASAPSRQTCTRTPAACSTRASRSCRRRLRLLSSAARISITASTRDPVSHTSRSALSAPTRCSHSV